MKSINKAKKIDIKKNDLIIVLSGKDKKVKGKVLKVFPKDSKVLVEGINMVVKHMRPTQEMPEGKITKKEAPILRNKVKLVCPHCHQPTRIGKQILESGESVRVCKVCKEIIDKV